MAAAEAVQVVQEHVPMDVNQAAERFAQVVAEELVEVAVIVDAQLYVAEIVKVIVLWNVLDVEVAVVQDVQEDVQLNVQVDVQTVVALLVVALAIPLVQLNATAWQKLLKYKKEIKMDNKIKIDININLLDMIQAYFEDYKAKQDLITMLFELHKFDEDASILESVPFKHYEREFREAKIAYDTCMEEIRKTCIPQEYQAAKYKFDIDFEDKCIYISSI